MTGEVVRFRECCCRSWLDPRTSRMFAALLSERLRARCSGERGVFLTLTYDREQWQDARELWRATGEQQHVPLFMRRLARTLGGASLKGRWFCKAEFQRGGWVHFHVILLGVERIPHANVSAAWGHGHVWIQKLTPSRIRYACKYVAKCGEVPNFLLAEKRVTIVRVSPGFWLDTRARPAREDPEPIPDGCIVDLRGCAWVPIGDRIALAGGRCVVHHRGRYSVVDLPALEIVRRVLVSGGCMIDPERGWSGCVWGSGQARGAAQPPAGWPDLHLTEIRKPDVWVWRGWLLAENCVEVEAA